MPARLEALSRQVHRRPGHPGRSRPARLHGRWRAAGPEFVTIGSILNSPGPNQNLLRQLVTTAEEARAAVHSQHAAGFRRVKVYSNLTGEALGVILDEAARPGLTVTGHSPEGVRTEGVPWEASVGRGFRTLEHVETIAWHALRDDLDEGRMRAVAERLATSGDTVTPTLIAHRRLVLTARTRGAYLGQPARTRSIPSSSS